MKVFRQNSYWKRKKNICGQSNSQNIRHHCNCQPAFYISSSFTVTMNSFKPTVFDRYTQGTQHPGSAQLPASPASVYLQPLVKTSLINYVGATIYTFPESRRRYKLHLQAICTEMKGIIWKRGDKTTIYTHIYCPCVSRNNF